MLGLEQGRCSSLVPFPLLHLLSELVLLGGTYSLVLLLSEGSGAGSLSPLDKLAKALPCLTAVDRITMKIADLGGWARTLLCVIGLALSSRFLSETLRTSEL